jgi:Asp-tRNA(Asn)/Glu-tRNA(Gln) amidotransferase A subunit family amidase
MDKNSLYKLSASESIKLIKSNQISILELISSINDRVKEFNPKTNAWVSVNSQQSEKTAIELDKKINSGMDISPLFGIPIGIKDVFNTENFPTEMGSPLWKNFTSGNDSRVVYNLRMANAIILGKTETAEFAVHALGKTKNPFDENLSPGTSSSGSAVAVATEMVPISIGTQTGGSIIRPASYCGVYGFKPSFGLIPRTGMLKTTDSLDQIGYFTRTVKDLELIFDIIRVKGRDYPLTHILDNAEKQNVSNRKWKICLVKSPVWDCAESYAQKNLESFVHNLSNYDIFDISEFELPSQFDDAHLIHKIIYSKSLSYYFKEELTKKSLISKIFYEFATDAKEISLEKFDEAIQIQNKLRKILNDIFSNFDIIFSLSTASHAPLRTESEKDDPSLIWTLCGNPSVNIPVFNSPKGLPIGIQVIAKRFNDKLLLNFLNLLREKNLIPDIHHNFH